MMLKKKSMRHSLSEGHLPPGHPDLSHPLANSAAIVKDGNMNGINENGADGDDGKLSRQSSVLSLFDNTSPFVIPKVTREHWKPDNEAMECYNLSCRKNFGFFERKHHCRKCGNIFCSSCLDFQLRLDPQAQVCSNGALSKVCITCFIEFQAVIIPKPRAGSLSSGEKSRDSLLLKNDMPLKVIDDLQRRQRESSEDTLVNENVKAENNSNHVCDSNCNTSDSSGDSGQGGTKKCNHKKNNASLEFFQKRKRAQEMIERRFAQRPSLDEISDKLKNWAWSTDRKSVV